MRLFYGRFVDKAGLAAACVFALALTTGCGAGGDGLHTITGEVTWGGEPLPTGSITLKPVNSGRGTSGTIEAGEFSIPAKRGAKPGEYHVVIEAYMPTGKKQANPEIEGEMVDVLKQMIPPKYNERTELRAEVTSGGKNYFAFTLDK